MLTHYVWRFSSDTRMLRHIFKDYLNCFSLLYWTGNTKRFLIFTRLVQAGNIVTMLCSLSGWILILQILVKYWQWTPAPKTQLCRNVCFQFVFNKWAKVWWAYCSNQFCSSTTQILDVCFDTGAGAHVEPLAALFQKPHPIHPQLGWESSLADAAGLADGLFGR